MQYIIETHKLIKASFIAILLAIIVLMTVILPAEYNLDPLGVGQKIGLTALVPTADLKLESPNVTSKKTIIESQSDTIEITVPAGRGVEYKFQMAQHTKMTYEWLTDGEALYFDLHGEPEGDTSGYFESYAIATAAEMKGSYTTPFAGSHGWYWKNTSDKDIQVQLMISGDYHIIGLKK